MPDLRIFSYLPNPRLYKATIAARFSGVEIEIIGAKPPELANWLWDYNAHELREGDREKYASFAREAKMGFSGTLFKSDAFLAANPYGDVPCAFGEGGKVGLFESNSIMRAAARLGGKAPHLYGGDDPLQIARIDGFLDRSLVFARDMQRYLLAGREEMPKALHEEMESAFASYLTGAEQALSTSEHLAGSEFTLADICFVCEMCLFTNEKYMVEKALTPAGLRPLLPRLKDFARVQKHLMRLSEQPEFSQDLASYFDRLP